MRIGKNKLSGSRKFMLLSALLAVVLVATVTPSIAYLQAASQRVVNTFAGGLIQLILDEAPVDSSGKATEGPRTLGNSYKVIAGDNEFDKDPTATIKAGSEPCYVFLCVENGLGEKFAMNFSDQWTKVAEGSGKVLYAYANGKSVDAGEQDVALPAIFTKVTATGITEDEVAALSQNNKTLAVTAYAVQSDGLDFTAAQAEASTYFSLQANA